MVKNVLQDSTIIAIKPHILVVDDQPINIKLLQRKLEREGYSVATAMTGIECLEHVADKRPDIILLDVMMPEMDGIETCQRLKDNADTGDIPIIFITAKSSKEGKLEGLEAGAVDYITKPIDLDETLARVRTQLRIQEIYRQNLDLQKRLGDSRKAAAVGAITQGIAHNLNNLLGVVVGYLDLLKSGFDSPDMVKRSVGLMDQAIQRMVNIIRNLSTIATSERLAMSELSLKDVIQSSIERFHEEFEMRPHLTLDLQTPEDQTITANEEVFEGVMCRLLSNAYEAYPRQEIDTRRLVTIKTELGTGADAEYLIIAIIDQGMGIDESVLDNVFEPFITTKTSVGRGLGLTMARHSIRNIKGELDLAPGSPRGAIATIRYPLEPKFVDSPDFRMDTIVQS